MYLIVVNKITINLFKTQANIYAALDINHRTLRPENDKREKHDTTHFSAPKEKVVFIVLIILIIY